MCEVIPLLPLWCAEGQIGERTDVTGDGEEDVSSYWMTLRKRKDTGN
jgi:hypothetical protein